MAKNPVQKKVAAKQAAAPKVATPPSEGAQAKAAEVAQVEKNRTSPKGVAEQSKKAAPGDKMVPLKETGLAGPGEKTKDGGTSGNPHAVPEGTSAAQFQRGANVTDKGFQDAPGSRPLALKQALEGFKRQLEILMPEWSQNENKLVMEKLDELQKLADTGMAKAQPDGFVSAKA